MRIDVMFLPAHARPGEFAGKAVAVFDVLRATTTMAVALGQGVRTIRVFDELDSTRAAAKELSGVIPRPLLVGETKCLPPADFDLGNSPVAMADPGMPAELRGRTLLMSTTNGTRAIVAARGAGLLVTAALVNARAAARVLSASGMDVTLLCAGTNGEVAMEDVIGAGAVAGELMAVRPDAQLGDAARMAVRLFEGARDDLPAVLAQTAGGRNVIAAGLPDDVTFAARLNVLEVVGRVADGPLRVENGTAVAWATSPR